MFGVVLTPQPGVACHFLASRGGGRKSEGGTVTRMRRTELFLLCASIAACPAPEDSGDDAAGDESSTGTVATTTGDTPDTGGEEEGATDGGSEDGMEGGSEDSGGSAMGGCGVDPGLSGDVSGQVEIDGEPRRFLLVVPEDYDPNRQYPLFFMFHGRGSNGEQFRQYNGVEELGTSDAIFVYPDALPNAIQMGQTGWDLTTNGIDVALVDKLIEDFTTNLCIDEERIFATGHSHGGFFSNALGCSRGDVFRAIAPVAGGGPGQGCEGEVAAWLAHHPDDDVVPLVLGQVSRDHWLETNGCGEETSPVDPDPCVEYQGCNEGYEVVWCEHMDDSMFGPHSWPAFAGPAIWEFFSRF